MLLLLPRQLPPEMDVVIMSNYAEVVRDKILAAGMHTIRWRCLLLTAQVIIAAAHQSPQTINLPRSAQHKLAKYEEKESMYS